MVTSATLLKKKLVLDLPERCPAWDSCHFTSKSLRVLHYIYVWWRLWFITLQVGWEIVKKFHSLLQGGLLFSQYSTMTKFLGVQSFTFCSGHLINVLLGHWKIFSQYRKTETLAETDLRTRTGFTNEWHTNFCWERSYTRQEHLELRNLWQR